MSKEGEPRPEPQELLSNELRLTGLENFQPSKNLRADVEWYMKLAGRGHFGLVDLPDSELLQKLADWRQALVESHKAVPLKESRMTSDTAARKANRIEISALDRILEFHRERNRKS